MKINKTLILTTLLTVTTTAAAYAGVSLNFPDVPIDAAYAEAVVDLEEAGIITGDDFGNFNPDKTITRAEFSTMILRMLGETDRAESTAANRFTDVASDHWALGYIAVAAELGLINGYGEGLFGPEDPLTYEQALKILVCTLGMEEDAADSGGYPDGYITVAIDAGIVKRQEAALEKPITRAAMAELMARTLALYEID